MQTTPAPHRRGCWHHPTRVLRAPSRDHASGGGRAGLDVHDVAGSANWIRRFDGVDVRVAGRCPCVAGLSCGQYVLPGQKETNPGDVRGFPGRGLPTRWSYRAHVHAASSWISRRGHRRVVDQCSEFQVAASAAGHPSHWSQAMSHGETAGLAGGHHRCPDADADCAGDSAGKRQRARGSEDLAEASEAGRHPGCRSRVSRARHACGHPRHRLPLRV